MNSIVCFASTGVFFYHLKNAMHSTGTFTSTTLGSGITVTGRKDDGKI